MHRLILFLLTLTTGLLSTHGSLITWGAAQNTTAATDVSTLGTLVVARNTGGAATTANGVLFGAGDPLGSPGTGMLNGATSGDAGFDALLNTVSFGGGTSTTIDLAGIVGGGFSFTPGVEYQVQVFFTDQRAAPLNTRVMTYGSQDGGGSGPTVNVAADPNTAVSSPFGQFAVGTFTADGDDPDLVLTTNGFGNAHVTALQIRNVVPEPSALTLLGLGGFALALARRARG